MFQITYDRNTQTQFTMIMLRTYFEHFVAVSFLSCNIVDHKTNTVWYMRFFSYFYTLSTHGKTHLYFLLLLLIDLLWLPSPSPIMQMHIEMHVINLMAEQW